MVANAVSLAREPIIFSMVEKNPQGIEKCIKFTACLWLDFLRFVGDGSDPYLARAWSYYYLINQFILRNLTWYFARLINLIKIKQML